MSHAPTLLILLADVLTGGELADGGVGDFLTIVGGCVGIGAGVGSAAAWVREPQPDWGKGAGYGSLGGLLLGLALAWVDAGLVP